MRAGRLWWLMLVWGCIEGVGPPVEADPEPDAAVWVADAEADAVVEVDGAPELEPADASRPTPDAASPDVAAPDAAPLDDPPPGQGPETCPVPQVAEQQMQDTMHRAPIAEQPVARITRRFLNGCFRFGTAPFQNMAVSPCLPRTIS